MPLLSSPRIPENEEAPGPGGRRRSVIVEVTLAGRELVGGDVGLGLGLDDLDQTVDRRQAGDHAGDELLVGDPCGGRDPGDDAVAGEGGEGLDLEDLLVVAIAAEDVDADEPRSEVEGLDSVASDVLDAADRGLAELGRADHRLDALEIAGTIDLHRAEDLAVEEDDLDLDPVDRALDEEFTAVRDLIVDDVSDLLGAVEAEDAATLAPLAGLEDRRPPEVGEGAGRGL